MTKINTAFAVALTDLALISLFSVWGILRLLDAIQWRRHTYEVIIKLDEITSSLNEGETGAYGYLMTGNAIYLKAFDTSIDAVHQKVNDIAKLTLDNPTQQHRIDILKPMIIEKNALIGELIGLLKNKRTNASDEWVLADREKIVMDNIQKLISEIKREEYSLLKQRSGVLDSSTRTLILIIIAGNLMAFASGFLIAKKYYNAGPSLPIDPTL